MGLLAALLAINGFLYCSLYGGVSASRIGTRYTGASGRITTSAASTLHEHLLSLPSEEPHHVCVTGNRAHEVMESVVMPGEHSLSNFTMESTINPANECEVQEYASGHTLFLVTDEIRDRCSARWKVHSSSCDVLVHAHAGEDCSGLYKLRMVTSQCDAPLVVLHSGEDLLKCYDKKVGEARSAEMMKLGETCTDLHHTALWGEDGSTDDAVSTIKQALMQTAEVVRQRYQHFQGSLEHLRGNASSLRRRLHSAKSDGQDLMLEFLKSTQRVSAHGGAIRALQTMVKEHRAKSKEPDKSVVVIDNGSGRLKAGFGNDELPRVVFPAAIGTPKYEGIMIGVEGKTEFVGNDLDTLKKVLKRKYPVRHGIVTDWDAMRKIWRHALEEELQVDPADVKVLITEAPLNPLENRARAANILYEDFKVPAMYVAVQAVLSLYGSGRTTGVVLDSGDGVTHIVPIWEGFALEHQIKRLDLAGDDLTEYMQKILREVGVALTSSAEKDEVRKMKEELTYTAMNFEQEMELAKRNLDADGKPLKKDYTLPDDSVVTVGDIRFRVPEVLFRPSLLGMDVAGIHQMLGDAILECAIDLQEDLWGNIVLSGGTMMIPKIDARLKKELLKVAPARMGSLIQIASVEDPNERAYAVFMGGSIMASMDSMDLWVDAAQFNQKGVAAIRSPGR